MTRYKVIHWATGRVGLRGSLSALDLPLITGRGLRARPSRV